MALSSSQLEAFAEVAKTGNFSKAAKNLHITQSALSQRILNLEEDLSTGLIIRDPAGLRLTAAGEELLRYCHVKMSLEKELLDSITSSKTVAAGIIRIAGFSSVMRSVIMPSLTPLVTSSPHISVEYFSRELHELPRMLSSNEADIIITTNEPFKQEIISHHLGYEENVLVESAKKSKERQDIYIDHDPDDSTTQQFLKLNGALPKKLNRIFLDEVYAIIDGVRLGWGRAVLPRHLVSDVESLKIVKSFKPLNLPVRLQYFHQPFYSRLHTSVVEHIVKNATKILS